MTPKAQKMNKIILELAVESTELEANPLKLASPNLRSLLAKLIVESDYSLYTQIALLERLSIKIPYVNMDRFDYLSAVESFIRLTKNTLDVENLENVLYNKIKW